MSSASIQAKIKAGLSKAVNAVGSPVSEKVYVVVKTKTGGGNDPLNPPIFSDIDTLLVNAIFKSYNKNLIGDSIKAGDRELISNNDVEIKEGATIKQGTTQYVVISSEEVAPTSDVLLYKSQVRVQ